MRQARWVVAAVAAGFVALTPPGAQAQERLCFDRADGFQAGDGDLPLAGDAQVLPDGTLRLTPATAGRTGMALARQPVDLGSGFGFDTTFRFRIDARGGLADVDDGLGGDGFAFVVQGAAEPNLGRGGSGMGYDGLRNSLAVEFDTWGNQWDIDGNHVAVHSRGVEPNSVDESGFLSGKDGVVQLLRADPVTVRIRYTPPDAGNAGRLDVLLDGSFSFRADVDLSDTLDLEAGLGYVGFTAATGDAFENHDILGWTVCRSDAVDEPVIVAPRADNYTLDTNTTLHVPPPGVLGNDRTSGDPVVGIASAPRHGAVAIEQSGEFTYTPEKDFAGQDNFVYRLCSGDTCGTAPVFLTVRQAPVSVPTALTATPAVAEVGPGAGATPFLELSARLTAMGEPLVGRRIAFSAGGTNVCAAETDEDGVARCGAPAALAQTVLSGTYTARFGGAAAYGPSSATAPAVKVNQPADP